MHRHLRLLLALPLLLGGLPAIADDTLPQGAWKLDGNLVRVVSAGIALPIKAGDLALGRTLEASEKGKGIDDIAQYTSESGRITGTAYVYFTPYADAALAGVATDQAIRLYFGADVTVAGETMVPAGGVPSAAIRRVYEKAVMDGQAAVTLAAFVRADSWMVVLRVNAPSNDRARAEEALDALIAGLHFDGKAKPIAATKPQIAAPCPAIEQTARFLGAKKSMPSALLGAFGGGSVVIEEKGKPDGEHPPLAFPANGQMPMCVSGEIKVNGGVWPVLRPTTADAPPIELVPISDAGKVLAIEPTLDHKGFVMKIYSIGRIQVYGTFDRLLTPAQLTDVLGGKAMPGTQLLSTTLFQPNGDTQINIDPSILK